MDDIEALMPRTKAANDRAPIDKAKLKQYIATKDAAHSVGARSGVVVRGDVRKDAEGFEDIDDFWVDDDSMQDDSVDDDDSLTGSDKESADTSGDVSEPSEHEVELADIDSPPMSDRESMDIETGPIPSRSRSQRRSDRVEREEKKEDADPAPSSPMRSDVSFDFGGSPHDSVDMNTDKNVTIRDRRKKSTEKDDTVKKAKARRRESFGRRGFDEDMASPFSMNEGQVTPLSNASDRTLKSIPSFSDKNSLSPNISKELFKKGDYDSDANDEKTKKKQTKGKKAKKTGTGKQSVGDAKKRRIRPTGKYGYRTAPPATDTSVQSVQTDDDNDESFEAQNDSGGETGDDSFYNEPDAPTGPVRDRLPDASRILDEDNGDAWDGSGLRRSKRRRFKPLAWFKSEHMVYERTFVGVGTVMPTVVGVERLGHDSPSSKRTKAKPPSKRTNNSRSLTLKELPKDMQKRIVDSEWATLYDDQAGCMNDLNIICRSSEIRLRKLPTEERGGAVVHAYAGQSFNLFSPSPFARWISGRVVLPPGAWKEPEGVGQAVQLFYVTGCQPKSLELALAPETDDDFFSSKFTTHFLLSPGDEFYVPAGNVYYVKNHSSSADCDLRFTILKPEASPMPDDNDSDPEQEQEKEEPTPTESKPEATEPASSPLKRKREEDADVDADAGSDSVRYAQMDPTASSSKMDEIYEIIKEGSVAVRGHFMWRDRYVLIKPGEMVIRRRREGSIKAKIDLLDANIKLTFLGGQSLLTISMHGRDIVFDFRSTVTRDEWISAIVSAQERPGSDEECDENGTELLSGDETDDHEGHKRSSMTSMGTEKSDTLEEESEGYNDALLALQSMAEQLTVFHHSQLTNVYPWEFLHHPKQAAKALTDHFNRLVAYFVWSVLVEDSPKERAEVIEDIISIAMAASAPPLNNFHLVMACVGCLGDTPLMSSRMPTTWKKVRAKYKTRLGELRRLCDHSGGFENLRRKQSTESARPVLSSDVSTASIIPFIGVIGVMLERLRSTSYFTAKKMLDLDKLERQYMVLNVLENALLKPAPRPSRAPQRGKTSPTETATQMTTRMQQFFETLKMEFATPRLHQLRSQQILANETSATSSASASFVLTATVNGSNRGGVPLTASLATSSSHGSIGPSEDSGLPFVSFRDICVLLVSVPDTRERIQMALEALFVDGRQPATQFLRKFWLDFKLNVWISGVGPTLHSVRLCVSALYQEVMTHKITELMQISGLDENSSDLHDMVYAKVVVMTVQPIYLKIVSKVKRNFVKEDAHASARLLKSTPQVVVDTSKPTMAWSSCSSSSPVELLDLVCQLVALPRASTTTAAVAATDHQLAAVELLGALQHQGRHTFLATNPVSSLYLMKLILDRKYLPLARRQALDVFVAAVTWLRKEQRVSSDEPQGALV
ncbi:hypothetical protein JG688_00000031 [Phytophthora aleatoria]|uniref:Ras-GEF domain-containing protein n=1 Tax=Phytophthora aleatoria TaxID=2496075 RepID=A0A8J5MAI2_9STRA|nr:hypothetical protein JG688_00000031 [Phytophthora aleatoria]